MVRESMAFIKCIECSEVISRKPSKCPYCGNSQRKKKPLLTVLIVILALAWFVVLNWDITSSNSSSSTKAAYSFEQIGYFKDSSKNRIFTIKYKQNPSEQEVKNYAEKLIFTPNKMMAAYFYNEGSTIPADGITLSNSIVEANNTLYEMPKLSKWRYAFIKYVNGTSEFVNCIKQHDNDLCRK